jgi:prevent-host-death family protein
MQRAAAGEEIVVTRRGRPSVRLNAVAVQPQLAEAAAGRRTEALGASTS